MKKPLLLLAAIFAAVFCLSADANAQTITISGVSASYCAGAGSSVTFTASGGTITAASVFSVELSDAAGSFGAPTVISNATFTGALTGSIPITIPIASPAGSGYLMRVVCTSPTFTGSNSSAFTINLLPSVIATPPAQTICSGTAPAIALTSSPVGATFAWTIAQSGTSGATASSGSSIAQTLATTAAVQGTTTYTVTATLSGCSGSTTPVVITVNPLPAAVAGSNISFCNAASTVLGAAAVVGNTYAWLPVTALSSATASNPTATNTATTTYTVTETITATGCFNSNSVIVTVNPLPAASVIANTTICSGAGIAIGATTIAGHTYAWLPATALSSASVSNPTASPTATTTYTLTETITATTCVQSNSVIITVNPLPSVIATPSSQSICSGAAPSIALTSSPASATFAWTIAQSGTTGATASSGSSIAQTLSTTAAAIGTTTYTVTATLNSCPGPTSNVVITVNPIPTVVSVSNQSTCNGVNTTAVAFSGTVTGTTFGWTNTLASIGLAASGSGNIAAFTATNTGTSNTVGTVTVTPTANSCVGSTANFSYTVKPTPTVNTISNQTPCNATSTTAVTFAGAVTGTTFGWTNNLTSIGLAATGSGNIAAFTATNSTAVATVGTVTVTPTASTCVGSSKTFTYTINPSPVINAITSQTHCNTVSTTAVTFTSPVSGSTFTWTNNTTSIGLAASGSGATIAAFTATNTGSAPVIATITVSSLAGICPGNTSFTFTVNPTPTINAISNQAICNTDLSTTTSFTGAVTGTSFGWTNNLISIGLAATGSGNINAFAAANTSTSPVTATVTVTPTANTCAGSPLSFTYTVNPTPDVVAISSQSLCNTVSTAAVAFSGAVTGTTFGWTNDLTSIGLAASGSGNIAAFATSNTGIVDSVATIIVTPTANSCPGATQSFTITVKPTPTVDNITNQVFCSGVTTTLIAVTSPVVQGTGTSFAWANSQTSIGLAASGVGDVPAFAAVNANIGTPAVTATVTITPTANGCVGPTNSFTYTINPLPAVPVIATHPSASVCLNTLNQNLGVTCATSGVSFAWNATNATITNGAALANAIIDFNAAGSSVVTVTATIPATGCINTANFTATVSATNVSVTPSIIYQAGRFICLLGSADSYQWGSDNKTNFAPTTFAGETSQDFVKANPLTTENYWVVTVQNGTCTAKSYFTGLGLGLQNVIATNVISISPNPTSSKINVVLNNSFQLNNTEIKIVNLLGQTVYTTAVKNHEVEINMEPLAANIYFIQVYSNNNLITVQKIVKQ